MYHIGLDVAKHHHDAIGLDDASHVVLPPFRFPNTRAGVEKLMARLEALGGDVRLAMESTGLCWPNILIRSLSGQSPKVVISFERLVVERMYYSARTTWNPGG